MKNVLVIGGGGYVGCVLCEELLAKGYSVRVVDRLYFGRKPLEQFLDRVDLVEEDVREVDESVMDGCAAVINVGGLSNDPTAEFNPRANEQLNTEASVTVARMAKRAGVPRLIFASTCSIYDRGVGEETRDILLDERANVEPKAAYATSKLAAEREILAMVDEDFCALVFRKGTIHGFSPRMRYDLVVNSFVKDALSKGRLRVDFGGEMWRPLIDVKDVARAYVMALEADADLVSGQIFNLCAGNYRISELALRVRRALGLLGLQVELDVDYSYRLVRSYRVSSEKIHRVLGFQARVPLEESVEHMVKEIKRFGYTDFSHPRYYNIEWVKLLEEAVASTGRHGYLLTRPAEPERWPTPIPIGGARTSAGGATD